MENCLTSDRKLYREMVELLLDRWESQRAGYDAQEEEKGSHPNPSLLARLNVDKDEVLGLFSELAYETHANQSVSEDTATIAQHKLVNGLIKLSKKPGC